MWFFRQVDFVDAVFGDELAVAHAVAHHEFGRDVCWYGNGVKSTKILICHDEAVQILVWASRQDAYCLVENLKIHEIVLFAIEFLFGCHGYFLNVVVLLSHPETDIDGIALQLPRGEAHHRVLIADTGIMQVDSFCMVVDGQFIMSFGVGAGAVWRIDDADVHITYTEVTVDHGFVLGCGLKNKTQSENNRNGVDFFMVREF